MTEQPTYALERVFEAPRELVWRSWTEAALLRRWYGPGVETVIHALDLRPGGLWLTEMRGASRSHHQKAEYLEVVPPERLVWLHATTDAEWRPMANPMTPDWPRLLYTVVTFAAEGAERTRMRLTWTPHEASEAETACFAAAIQGLDKGWGAGMKILEELLAELQG